jgi:hypothetical protein
MVTTADDDVEPIGAVAQLGGKVEALGREVTRKVTYGEPSLLTPLLLIVLVLPVVVLASSPPLMLLGVVALFALTVWCVVAVIRTKPRA